MNLIEFSDGFDTLVSSYRRFKDFDNKEILDSIEFDEYEKSFYLTKAQENLVVSLYNGKNHYGDTFESSEEMRRSLDSLIETVSLDSDDTLNVQEKLTDNSKVFVLPEDLMFITLEQIKFNDESLGCYNGSIANVQPIKQDEYDKVRNNPFRGPTRYRALRLDYGQEGNARTVEIVSKYDFSTYTVRYLKKPCPIILEDLPNGITIDGVNEATECELNPILHKAILESAVLMALRAKGINTER